MMKMPFFTPKVLKIVSQIPKGKVLTYKQVAQLAGSPRAYRAVGNILSKNHNPKIPCHRVIRSDGKVGGYNQGLKKKAYLLKGELIGGTSANFVGCSFGALNKSLLPDFS